MIKPKILKISQGEDLPVNLRDFHILVNLIASPGLSKFTISNLLREQFYGYKCKKIRESIVGESISDYEVLLKLNF